MQVALQQSSPVDSTLEGRVHVLSNGQSITLPPPDEFYARLVTRNRGLIADAEQQRLQSATILVAGCGSVGGAVIEPFVRLGAAHLVLAEPDAYDLPNLNRQSARLQDIGRNKAAVFQERMRDINPYASIEIETNGITDDNVERLVKTADLIIDAVDVTTKPPLRAKFALHERAKQFGVPVLAGYDIGGLQLLITYDYRRQSTAVLHGRVQASEVADIEPFAFLRRVIPIRAIPFEIIGELRRQIRGEGQGFPQLVFTAQLFGVLALPAALEILSGRAVRRQIIIDIPSQLRPLSARLRVAAARLGGLYHLNNEFRRSRGTAIGSPQH